MVFLVALPPKISRNHPYDNRSFEMTHRKPDKTPRNRLHKEAQDVLCALWCRRVDCTSSNVLHPRRGTTI